MPLKQNTLEPNQRFSRGRVIREIVSRGFALEAARDFADTLQADENGLYDALAVYKWLGLVRKKV